MIMRFDLLHLRPILLILALGACGLPAFAASSNSPSGAGTNAPAAKGTNAIPVELPIPKSHFAMPGEGGGKDPFYPTSARFQPREHATNTNVVAAPPMVRINGFSGTPAQPLVIINNATFGIGDEMSIPTQAGRVKVRCIEIRTQDESALVEVNGVRRELQFRSKK